MIPYYDPDESIEQVRANNRQALGMGSVGAVVSVEALARKRVQEAAIKAGGPASFTTEMKGEAAKTGWWEKAKPILVLGGIGLLAWWTLWPKSNPRRRRRRSRWLRR